MLREGHRLFCAHRFSELTEKPVGAGLLAPTMDGVRPTEARYTREFSDKSRRLCLGSRVDRLWWSLEIQRPGVAA